MRTASATISIDCNYAKDTSNDAKEAYMKYKLNEFTTTWDEAALETLGSEFNMMDLLAAQAITASNGSSILDYVVFDLNTTINVPDAVVQEVKYFKAPWDE